MSEEFRVLGMSVPRIAILNGVILCTWGVIAYFVQSSDPPSLTALIPAFMGMPMLLLGFLSESNPSNKHHYMHACMVVALIMALGGARVVTGYGGMSWLAIVSHLLLLQVGISFTIVGIKSFRHARMQRESSVIE
ncbi:MAG: hypothetical protein ACJZ42_05660 [Candidatus Thalassarchaeaceae archaeon]|nr:MAG: hypothetical protein CND84_04780 [Marine Group II euryarchaeote MED-G35]